MRKKVIETEKIVKPPIKHARFIVRDNNFVPVGYFCDGLEFKRKPGETEIELRARCLDSVDWPDSNTLRVFVPLQKQP